MEPRKLNNNAPLIFIRDDDIFKLDESFLNLYDLIKEYQIPLICGIIPKLAKKTLVSFLNKEKNKAPGLIDIIQHGWSHKNYSSDINNKYEFGPSRNYKNQKDDIYKGYVKMQKLFKHNFTPAFTPPFHGYDNITLKAIKALKIPLFSADETTKTSQGDFLDLPCRVCLNDYDESGIPIPASAKVMLRRFHAALVKPKSIVGILFHHEAIKNRQNLKELTAFFLFLSKLTKEGKIKSCLFSRLLRLRGSHNE